MYNCLPVARRFLLHVVVCGSSWSPWHIYGPATGGIRMHARDFLNLGSLWGSKVKILRHAHAQSFPTKLARAVILELTKRLVSLIMFYSVIMRYLEPTPLYNQASGRIRGSSLYVGT